jgi:protein-S-isoprenylcysteine O-methyltransferase Ste14
MTTAHFIAEFTVRLLILGAFTITGVMTMRWSEELRQERKLGKAMVLGFFAIIYVVGAVFAFGYLAMLLVRPGIMAAA